MEPIDAEQSREVERPVLAHPLSQRELEAAIAERRGLCRVEHGEVGSEPGEQRVGAEDPRAEPVESRDERPCALLCCVALTASDQLATDARSQLARRAVGKGDREDPARCDRVLGDVAHEPLDQHTRLAAAGIRRERKGSFALLDRGPLLLGEGGRAHAAWQRQTAGNKQPPR